MTLIRDVLALLGLFSLAFVPGPSPAAQPVTVYVFWRDGCPHCERELAFLDGLSARNASVRVLRFEVMQSREGRQLLERVGERLAADISSVPVAVIGGRVFVGYFSDSVTGRALEGRALECIDKGCADPVGPIVDELRIDVAPRTMADPIAAAASRVSLLPETIQVPLIGEVRTADLSLPALTVALAAIDGFNPCAMWVLVFLLGLLAGMKDRRRMWLLGGTFVVASALVYFVFLAAWLNVLLFLGAIAWVRIGIGAVALVGGGYHLREFVLNRDAVCEVTAPEARRRALDRLRDLSQRPHLGVALLGIVLLAFAVNLVELVCSAGIPAVFTEVLTLSNLAAWQYYAHLGLYILVFMADDLAVLALALATLHVSGLTGRYARWSNLLGGAILVVIGALLILRPEWLAFG